MVWPTNSVLDHLIAKQNPFAGKATQMAVVYLVPRERDDTWMTLPFLISLLAELRRFIPFPSLNFGFQYARVPVFQLFVGDSGP